MSSVEIKVNRNGPYIVQGTFTIADHKGNRIRIDGDQAELCRCGESQDKPFCDGSHRECDFKGEKAAVAAHNILEVEDEPS